jgi:hypothetical protein
MLHLAEVMSAGCTHLASLDILAAINKEYLCLLHAEARCTRSLLHVPYACCRTGVTGADLARGTGSAGKWADSSSCYCSSKLANGCLTSMTAGLKQADET